MSAPATNALSPLPVTMTERMESSCWKSRMAWRMFVERRCIERVQPLRALNREYRHAGLTLNEQVVKGHGASQKRRLIILHAPTALAPAIEPIASASMSNRSNVSARHEHLMVFVRHAVQRRDQNGGQRRRATTRRAALPPSRAQSARQARRRPRRARRRRRNLPAERAGCESDENPNSIAM